MASFFQRKPVRRFLAAFKWCRVTILFIVFLAVAALAYLQLVGLPDFLKNRLLFTLRQRGFDAQFTSARLGWGASIIVENAAFSPTNQAAGPHLSAGFTEMKLNARALLHAHLKVDSFQVLQGGLSLPVSSTNQQALSLKDVNLRVILLSSNLARLDECSAWSHGVRIHVNGDVVDFLAMRDWKLPQLSVPAPGPARPATAAPAAPRLTAWQFLDSIHFTGTPELNLHFFADGRDQNTIEAELDFAAAGAQSPWGQSGPFHLRAAGFHLLQSGDAPFLKASLLARDLDTRWASGRDLSAAVEFARDAATNLSALAQLSGHDIRAQWPSPAGSNWVHISDLRWNGGATLSTATFRPAMLSGTLSATSAQSGWGSVGAASMVLRSRHAAASAPADPAMGFWNQFMALSLDWQIAATNILTPKLSLERLAFDGGWHPPQLSIAALEASMYRGRMSLSGGLNVASREVEVRASEDFDPHQVLPLLSGPVQHWISLCDWETPPKIGGSVRLVLPPWTNRMDVLPEESLNSFQLSGDFSVGRGAFRGIAVDAAQSHFTCANRQWNVSGLRVLCQDGALNLDYSWNELTHDYHFRFDGKFDPAMALPLMTPTQQRTLHEFAFPEKPEIHGDVWGRWGVPAVSGFAATLAAGRFVVRGETVNELNAHVDFTNQFLRISQLSLARDEGRVEVPLAGINFASNIFSMSNASSGIDPEAVRRALGRIAPPFMQEVHFDSPPLVKASGSFTPGDDFGTDMHFFVQGRHFHWSRLNADSIQGVVDYRMRSVSVTNVQAGLYKSGTLKGSANFEWVPRGGTRFSSDSSFADINLGQLAQELSGTKSKLEGMLDGHLALAAPLNARETNFFGQGWMHVHNGLLWDIKIFGALSPMLNAIAPGAGNSRARDAKASFIITNGAIFTDDLEIRATEFRLLYRGTLDAQSRINARVEANLLRDTPVFGHFLGWMLKPLDKLFEYKISGTLQKPVTEPLYIPKIFMNLLRPFHSLKSLMTAPSSKPAPAPSPPPQ